MNLQAALLDKVKETCSIPSDNALALRINITRAAISEWRSGHKHMTDERIAQLCALAKLDPAPWLAQMHIERSHTEAERNMWRSILERLRPAAAVAGLALIGWALGADADGIANALILPAISSPMPIMFKDG